MKIKIIIVLVFLLSCGSFATGVENPIDMVTLNYRDFEYIMIESNDVVDLIYISSDLSENDLSVSYINYYPGSNETKYLIKSNEIIPDYFFEPGIKSFYYQDLNSGQIYRFNVDYTDIIPPVNEYESLYMELLSNYSILTNNYNILFENFTNQTNMINRIKFTLDNYINITGLNLSFIVNDLYTNFTNISTRLNNSLIELEQLKIDLNNMTNNSDDIQDLFNNLTVNNSILKDKYKNLSNNYSKLNDSLLLIGPELSQAKLFIENLEGYSSGYIYYKGELYHPFNYYKKKIKDLQNNLGLVPLYIFIFVFLTVIIMLAINLVRRRGQEKSPIENEDEIGYGDKHREVDRFSLSKSVKKIIPSKKKNKEESKGIEINGKINSVKKEIQNEMYNVLDMRMTPIEKTNELMLKKIDELLDKKPVRNKH